MVSFETFRTFEMILAVSLTRLDSRRTSKDSLVENLTIRNKNILRDGKQNQWISIEDHYLWGYASAL